MRLFKNLILIFVFVSLFSCHSDSKNVASLDLRDRVHKVVLKNGLKVLLLHREGAPIFSAQIKVKVGNIEETPGSRGLAHFFEHMAFKGTDQIGSLDYAKEKAILDQVFQVGTEIVKKRDAGASPEELKTLLDKRHALEEEQKKYIDQNEFSETYQKNGGADLNASTSNDFTSYYVSLPTSKLELWAYMESERFKHPVMREFFTENDVVAEERRMRVDNTPDGLLFEAYMNVAFDKSPFKVMVIGPAADIARYTPAVAQAFYDKYYIPSRTVIAVAGNFDVKDAEKIIRRYFEDIPVKEDNATVFSKEDFDPKTFPREVTVKGDERPRFYLGYHRPSFYHEDDIVMDVIQDVMCSGRTSRLYKKLVLEDKIAQSVNCFSAIPGARLDSLFTFYAMPLGNHTNKEIAKMILAEVKKLATDGPTTYELEKVKNAIDADLIYSLQSNSGLASQLAFYESLSGDWQYMYHMRDRVHKITADDVKRVVSTYFVPEKQAAAYYE